MLAWLSLPSNLPINSLSSLAVRIARGIGFQSADSGLTGWKPIPLVVGAGLESLLLHGYHGGEDSENQNQAHKNRDRDFDGRDWHRSTHAPSVSVY